jgi:hypothetical protein
MPAFTRRPLGLPGWFFIVCLLAVGVYFLFAKPGALFIVMGVFAALFWLTRQQNKREAKKLLALASEREGQSICDFTRDFNARAVDTWIIRAVYEQLQGQLKHVHPKFPVRADDRLKEDLLLDDDLNMDLAQEVETRTGRSIDDTESNPYFGKVRTVRDFVLFFQNQTKASDAT